MFASFNARALGLTLPADETLRLASENGFGGVDLMVRDLVEQGVDLAELRRKMGDFGLRPGAFPMPFDWRTSDRAQFEADLDGLSVHAQAAATIGLRRTATWVMPETPERPESPQRRHAHAEAVRDMHRERLAGIARTLNGWGIRLGLEVIGPETARTGRGWPFLCNYRDLEPFREELELLAGVPIGVLVDTWHFHATGETIEAATAPGVDRILWVHVADLPKGDPPDRSRMIDSVRGLPGEHGAIDSRAVLTALRSIGYDGPVTAEPLARCRSLAGLSPDEVARAAARSLRAVWPE